MDNSARSVPTPDRIASPDSLNGCLERIRAKFEGFQLLIAKAEAIGDTLGGQLPNDQGGNKAIAIPEPQHTLFRAKQIDDMMETHLHRLEVMLNRISEHIS